MKKELEKEIDRLNKINLQSIKLMSGIMELMKLHKEINNINKIRNNYLKNRNNIEEIK